MKTLMAVSAAVVAAQGVWIGGSEIGLAASAALNEKRSPADAADAAERLLADGPILFSKQGLEDQRDRCALRAAREEVRDGEYERATHYLSIVGHERAWVSAEVETIYRSMPKARIARIDAALKKDDFAAALGEIERARTPLANEEKVADERLAAFEAEARIMELKAAMQAGNADAAFAAVAAIPVEAPLPLKARADDMIGSMLHGLADNRLAEHRAADAYRTLQRAYERLVTVPSVGSGAVHRVRAVLDQRVFGRPVRASLYAHPPLHTRDSQSPAPIPELTLVNAMADRSVTVIFVLPDGKRLSRTLAPGGREVVVLMAGDVLQLVDHGDGDALQAITLGNGRFIQTIDGHHRDAEPAGASATASEGSADASAGPATRHSSSRQALPPPPGV